MRPYFIIGTLLALVPTMLLGQSPTPVINHYEIDKADMQELTALKRPVWLFPRVKINEVMVNSKDYGEERGEYIELWNWGAKPVDISEWLIADGYESDQIIDISFGELETPGLVIPGGGFALIVDPDVGNMYDNLIAAYADPEKLIVATVADTNIGNGLSNDGGLIRIKTDYKIQGNSYWHLDLTYSKQWSNGRSIELCYSGPGGMKYFDDGWPSPGAANICK